MLGIGDFNSRLGFEFVPSVALSADGQTAGNMQVEFEDFRAAEALHLRPFVVDQDVGH